MNKSMLGKWDYWYKDVTHMTSFRYGNTITYRLAEDFLQGMDIEDWGCGTGAFKRLHVGGYTGVDGSKTPFVDVVADLCEYTSRVDGIMMRHVLEHNNDWEKVLKNAMASCTKRLCLVMFTPFSEETHVIDHKERFGIDVPDISFAKKDIEKHFEGHSWARTENIKTRTGYGVEHVYFVKKKQ